MKKVTLDWSWDDSCNCYRAVDDMAIYVIFEGEETGFSVGFFPAPGGECSWEDDLPSLDDAKQSAERCVEHVKGIWEKPGSNGIESDSNEDGDREKSE